MANNKLSFEQAMARLQEIVNKLEAGDGSLDEAMKLFEEGSKLTAACTDMLDKAEQKVTRLISSGGEEEIPFKAGE